MSDVKTNHTNVVVNMADAVRNRAKPAAHDDANLVTPSETLELVRAFSEIRDPAVRLIALNQLRELVTSQSA